MSDEKMEKAKEELKEARALQREGRKYECSADMAFLDMQKEMKVVPKAREAYNFKYAPYEKIAEVCFPTMWEHGFTISHASDMTAEGAYVVTTLTHASSGRKWISRYGYEAKAKDQERGKSLTYGKRYNTALLLGISIEGEPDRDDDIPEGAKKQPW